MDPYYLQQLAIGVSQGMIYALVALGFTLIFGVLNAVNFAHSEIYTLGAMAALLLLSSASLPLAAVLLLVALFGGLLGWGLERAAFRPLRRFADDSALKSRALRESTLLSSLALSIIVREALELTLGSQMRALPAQALFNTPLSLGPVNLVSGDLLIIGVSLALLLALQMLLKRTTLGLAIRAVADNPLGARYSGIDVNRVIARTFMLGSLLGAVAGVLVALYYGSVYPSMGFSPGLKAFVAMVMGGLTSIPGAVLSALILGISESLATTVMPAAWADMVPYLFLLLTLVFFPRGIFGGGRERV